jgi:hypothetical protein
MFLGARFYPVLVGNSVGWLVTKFIAKLSSLDFNACNLIALNQCSNEMGSLILTSLRKAYWIVCSTTYLKETNLWVPLCLKFFRMFIGFTTVALHQLWLLIIKNKFKILFRCEFIYMYNYLCCEMRLLEQCFLTNLLDNVFEGLNFAWCLLGVQWAHWSLNPWVGLFDIVQVICMH